MDDACPDHRSAERRWGLIISACDHMRETSSLMHDSVAQALRDWQGFYVLTGGAAATLAGLLFLAVQFGANVRYPAGVVSALETFVAPTFIRFVDVLFIAALALIPSETGTILGALLFIPTVANAWSMYVVLRRSLHEYDASELRATHWIWNVSVPAAAYLLLIAAGIALLLNLSWALTGLGAVTMALLITALLNTWQMMTWLSQQQIARQEERLPSAIGLRHEPTGSEPTEHIPK
jgi:hypothetical protein